MIQKTPLQSILQNASKTVTGPEYFAVCRRRVRATRVLRPAQLPLLQLMIKSPSAAILARNPATNPRGRTGPLSLPYRFFRLVSLRRRLNLTGLAPELPHAPQVTMQMSPGGAVMAPAPGDCQQRGKLNAALKAHLNSGLRPSEISLVKLAIRLKNETRTGGIIVTRAPAIVGGGLVLGLRSRRTPGV